MGNNTDKKIQELKAQGYNPVGVYDSPANFEDLDHKHSFDTYIKIIEGEMFFRMNEEEVTLRVEEEIIVPKNVIHYAKTGPEGAKYLHAEKH